MRLPDQLEGLDGLVIPGGESTTITRLMRLYGLEEAVRRFAAPVFGTCAGMILLDRAHLGLVDVEVRAERLRPPGGQLRDRCRPRGRRAAPMRAVFIRAPRSRRVGKVEVLAEVDGLPMLGPAGPHPGRAFHPELTGDTRVHESSWSSSERRCMSGHSKWSTIKHKKGAADAKRGKLFTKLSKAIIVAAKEGGADPAANLSLAERDREGEVVLDAQGHDRARDREGRRRGRRCGGLRDVVYEGYGPEGVAVLVEA